jgi:K(+)-stimulated pyrophosphate-energized sodium pump
VLIGTAVVGATTMIFSIIVALTNGLTTESGQALDPAPAVPAGLIAGGAVIYWFTGAAQAVTTGAYRAVEFIKRTSSWKAPKRPRWPIPRRWWRSARSTRRRAC